MPKHDRAWTDDQLAARASPAPAAPAPPAGGLAIEDLDYWHCRWFVGEAPVRYCGAPARPGTSYCAVHGARIYTPSSTVAQKQAEA